MINKMIHKDEFRLRILLTNSCNKNCNFCLNDFQPKEPEAFINPITAVDCLKSYGSFMKSIEKTSIVTFSGGEPGLHPWLNFILKQARYHCDAVKVVTNGMALRKDCNPYVDCWHIGVTSKDYNIREFAQRFKDSKNIVAQLVITEDVLNVHLMDVIHFYLDSGIRVKLFADFNSDRQEHLRSRIEDFINIFGEKVYTRYTGKQINRGAACSGCNRKCVTLKALWIFPDGSASTCPQGALEPSKDKGWNKIIKEAYEAHTYTRQMSGVS